MGTFEGEMAHTNKKQAEAQNKKKHGVVDTGSGSAIDGRDASGAEEELLKHLPKEQDRKAILGCLAAVLNIMYSHENSGDKPAVAARNNKGLGGVRDEIKEESMNSSFAIRSTNNDSDGSPSRRRSSRGVAPASKNLPDKTRYRSIQKELLFMSADMLLLNPDYATCFIPNLDLVMIKKNNEQQEQEEHLLLLPFLQSLSNQEAAFQCIAMLLFRFILLSSNSDKINNGSEIDGDATKTTSKKAGGETKIIGYDARVRYAFKYLAVSVLAYFSLHRDSSSTTSDKNINSNRTTTENNRLASDALRRKSIEAYATRKFGALEDGIAERLAFIARFVREQQPDNTTRISEQKKRRSLGQHLARGLKIGTAGVAAGTLFAITGGLAAPAIAAGIASVAGAGAMATLAITILTFPAATTIFGIGGGSLVASKMKKRTKGLSEFEIKKETPDKEPESNSGSSLTSPSPELSRTVFISGWLTDEHDFQRPFGVTPDNLTDKKELLGRFCSVYSPFVSQKSLSLLKQWKGKEDELWDILRSSYGKDPDSLLPLTGHRQDAVLTDSENNMINVLVQTMGFPIPTNDSSDSQNTASSGTSQTLTKKMTSVPVNVLTDVLIPSDDTSVSLNEADVRTYKAWDFHAEYSGEQYTVSWEKDLLIELSGTAKEFTADLAMIATEEVLKKTALHSLLAAVALPATLLSLTNIIDERWTLVAERADEAGVVLAQSLLDSTAGHRPVSLVGFSFGARIIYSCLKKLARHQIKWEEEQEELCKESKQSTTRRRKKRNPAPYNREPASIVEDVVLMGCPASVNLASWTACRRVVAGRLINCYSSNDLMLALMYRIKNLRSILSPPAGIIKVDVPGLENYDVSKLIDSHSDYCVAVREILDLVGYDQPRQVIEKTTQPEKQSKNE